MLHELARRIQDLYRKFNSTPTFHWGVVTAISPLQVQLDSSVEPLAGSPSTLVSGLAVGDRVSVMIQDRRATIVGRGGGGGHGLMGVITYTSNGTFQKANYPGLNAVRVRLVGAGGAGGDAMGASSNQHAAGGGGGGGGYAESYILAKDLPASVSVSVGTGGRDISGATGGNGGATAFGSLVRATGGLGGEAFSSHNLMIGAEGGAGGNGTAGDIRIRGDGGTLGSGYATLGHGGNGGSSQLGGGGRGLYTGAGSDGKQGEDGGNYGGGGGGGTANTGSSKRRGGYGANGVVIVELYS